MRITITVNNEAGPLDTAGLEVNPNDDTFAEEIANRLAEMLGTQWTMLHPGDTITIAADESQ